MEIDLISRTTVGRGAGLLAVALMAFGPIIIKVSDLPEFRFIFWRLLVASLVYVVILRLRGLRLTWSAIRDSFLGGLLFALQIVFFFLALRRTSATHATVVMALQPVALLAVARAEFGEHPRPSFYLWSLVAVSGVVLTISDQGSGSEATVGGDVLALIGMLLLCGYFVVSKRVRNRLDSATYQTCLTLTALVLITPMALISGHGLAPPGIAEWWLVIAMAVIPGTGHLLLNYAHAHVELSEIGLINVLFNVLVPIYAWWLISESITGLTGLGVAIAVGAVAILLTRPANDSGAPARI